MEQVRWKDDKGELMMEALIVYTITIFLLFFILAIFSALFQRWNLQIIANEAAARMAQTYRLDAADASSGYITEKDLVEISPYRYLHRVDSENGLKIKTEKKISEYAGWRLARTTYTKNVSEPKCSIVKVTPDAMGRRHLVLTITGEYAVPFGEALAFFGFSGTIEYEVTAYADCIDIIDYINLVDYVDEQTSLKIFSSKLIGLIDSVLSLFDNILVAEG